MENPSVPGQLDLLSLSGGQPAPASPPQSSPQSLSQSPPQLLERPLTSPSPQSGAERHAAARTLLIVDTETTGLDPQLDHCLEVGVILFDVPSRQLLAQQSFLLPVESNAAEAINRIPASATNLPQPWRPALGYLQTLLDAADLLVAHNAAFDRQWFGRGHLPATDKRWLCSMEDMRWPPERQLRSRPSVRDLALAYEIPVWAAHRALTDCIYLAEVFRRCEDLEQLIEHGLEPRQLMRAQVSYDNRHLARDAGFRWNEPVKGAWARRLSAREASNLDFPVVPVDPPLPLAS
ncbi:DNA polymerase III subunit epsilon [Synechococcus sp. MIT S9509]|uniref:3'-5' exonuclease n=1 Tax=unclassified Synechococcus TaxID=2626047 RepID=UPI0007BC6E6C|nr:MULTISPECIES: 3'-5' exonuclease [unclassified Synechococcus]KZR87384.1 DNA polymerase III subunit epsilon [Synechococcus sp. MIT S9504]KZR92786.1 DNA polymerase III subunit epsilon [Synechococcus sp. MIT S9509]